MPISRKDELVEAMEFLVSYGGIEKEKAAAIAFCAVLCLSLEAFNRFLTPAPH